MARWVAWEVEEFRLLIDLIERQGARPPAYELESLSRALKRRGAARTERAAESSFRSVGSIASQISRLSPLMRGDPGAEAKAPSAMRTAWAQYQSREPALPLVVREGTGQRRQGEGGFEADRQDLALWLTELRSLLADLAEQAERLVDSQQAEEFRDAWSSIEEERPIELAIERLKSPEIEPQLAAVGLVGPALRLKLSGFRRASRRLVAGLTWTRLKPVLKWANVTLGSLTSVLAGIDPVKELKEAWEAAAEEAYEQAE